MICEVTYENLTMLQYREVAVPTTRIFEPVALLPTE
jgi:hypothetical protein